MCSLYGGSLLYVTGYYRFKQEEESATTLGRRGIIGLSPLDACCMGGGEGEESSFLPEEKQDYLLFVFPTLEMARKDVKLLDMGQFK